jgi:hypothetical protein
LAQSRLGGRSPEIKKQWRGRSGGSITLEWLLNRICMLPFWKRAFFGKEFKVARLGLFPNDTTMYYVAVCFGSVWALREMLELALQR